METALTEMQKRLLSLFKLAIEREQESQRLYEEMAGNCEDAELRQVIDTLRDSERMHEELLMERYKLLRKAEQFQG
jgi:rubrerythrin